MRAVAAIPAIGLLTGLAIGLAAPDVPVPLGIVLLCASAAVGVWALRVSVPLVLAVAVGGGFAAGGAMLSADASRKAWRPPLRVAFERLAQAERAAARDEGRHLSEDDEAFATIEGVLRADAAASPGGVLLSVAVDLIRGEKRSAGRDVSTVVPPAFAVDGGTQITVAGTLASTYIDAWRAGRRVRMPVRLRRPSRYLNPDVPDLERALARRGTALVGTVKSGALVEVVERGSPLSEAAAALRAFARRALAEGVGPWSRRSAGIVAAIVIGDRAGLDPDVQRRLQDAGTYHVIAISGGNIAILAGLLFGAFRLFGVLGRAAIASAIVVLMGYAHLVGGGASVNRATLMAVVYFAARGLDHRTPPLNALAFAAVCLLASEPLSVIDPALVLTFGATLALLLVQPVMSRFSRTPLARRPFARRGLPRLLGPLVGLLAASIAVELLLLPVGALFFSRVTFAGLLLNFAAVPLMGVAQVAGMAVVPVSALLPRAGLWTGFVAHVAAAGLVKSADLVDLFPAATFRVARPSVPAMCVYYVGLALALSPVRSRLARRAAVTAVVLAAIWIVAEPWAFVASRGDGRMHATFLDVGQGDSTLVRLPSGSTLLVDAGGLTSRSTLDVGDRVVAPVLRAAGIRRLDVVALTHGDPDHVGGAPSVIREFKPGSVWEGVPVPPFEPLRALRAEAAAAGARWWNVKAGDALRLDGVDLFVRHPPPPDWERQRVRNDDSIVLELRWQDVSIFLTGDIGSAVERALLGVVPAAPIRVVKVPHHGSLTSSAPEFVRALAPAVAVVSAGRSNPFGHPAPDVLRRYREAGAEIFRTDRDGAVTVDTDGRAIHVRGFTGRTFDR